MQWGLELHFLSPFQGSGLSLCLMSQTCSPVPLRKMIVLHGEILPPWVSLLRPCPCPGVALPLLPTLGWLPNLALCAAPWACGTASAVCRVPRRERVCFMPENHLVLQAFEAWCAGGVCSASPVPQESCRVCVWTDLYLHRRHHDETAGWGTVDKPPHEP